MILQSQYHGGEIKLCGATWIQFFIPISKNVNKPGRFSWYLWNTFDYGVRTAALYVLQNAGILREYLMLIIKNRVTLNLVSLLLNDRIE